MQVDQVGVQRHRITFEERGASGDGDKRFAAWPHVEAGAVHNFDPGCESTTTTTPVVSKL